ncbi:GNAT family N-acetyltransferase [Actinomadura sp. DC4]|uniref:GNAT family N-acetyltransferase n=1 Tax=Actinomadura sp. DC4 TaxID=3055069 RepID=UPI0025AECF38|nr:GNAT family N-acetyltransferase [Actinomadura sp. DC4]MDN3351994.1 GNAT family N-acetyltransferase [Actinomadura sp. DC4]
MKPTVHEVTWADPDAAALRAAMESEMADRYADRIAASGGREIAKVNGLDADHVVWVGVARTEQDGPVGHAALRWNDGDLELKRMYVAPSHRGTGVSSALLTAAEDAARALGGRRIVLQTGDRQPDAVRLYERAGYAHIPIFPPYERLTFSTCMAKPLR